MVPGNANALDSRAFAYFRNQQYAEAIADANAALAISPRQATSLYVRGLAEMKSGNQTAGAADIAAAMGAIVNRLVMIPLRAD